MSQTPEGFSERRAHGVQLVARSEHLEALVSLGLLEPSTLPTPAAHAADGRFGRSALTRLCLPDGDTILVRPYRRGGLLGSLLGSLHLGSQRPLQEVAVTEAARTAGVPTLEVLGAVIERVAPGVSRFWLISREVQGARDLLEILRDEPIQQTRSRVLEAASHSVRALHDAGIRHADLNLKNILIGTDTDEPRALVIDLDRSCLIGTPLGEADRLANLMRLLRSLRKQSHLAGRSLASPRDCVRFARGYYGTDRQGLRQACQRAADTRPGLRRLLWRSAES